MPINNTNPNSYGGSFNYDSRTGLGYGQLGNNPNSGLGSNWNMGDALSSPKGEWDDEEYSDTKECGCKIEIDCDCIDGLEIDIELKSPTSGAQFNRDAGSGKSSRNPNSYVGLANTSAHLGLSASHNRGGNVLREFILEAIKDILLCESPHMGGMTAASGLGRAYKPDTANAVSGYGMAGGTYGIDHDGYSQNGLDDDDKFPYISPLPSDPTPDGANAVCDSDLDTEWDEDLSTGESLMNALGIEEYSTASFEKHNTEPNEYYRNKNKYYS